MREAGGSGEPRLQLQYNTLYLLQGGTPPGLMREALGCVRRGGVASPAYNHSSGYSCPQGRLLAQNTSHSSKGIVFEQVSNYNLFAYSYIRINIFSQLYTFVTATFFKGEDFEGARKI